jgi:hypothetical protein
VNNPTITCITKHASHQQTSMVEKLHAPLAWPVPSSQAKEQQYQTVLRDIKLVLQGGLWLRFQPALAHTLSPEATCAHRCMWHPACETPEHHLAAICPTATAQQPHTHQAANACVDGCVLCVQTSPTGWRPWRPSAACCTTPLTTSTGRCAPGSTASTAILLAARCLRICRC